ncbi:hypothetical protein FQN54_003908 [Arachnomyces sp. PD_36]|nr:hypothetical protein FQN54_003908 [Arachnomyces sp. PD_36]
MSSRFPPIPRSELTPEQQKGYDEIERLTQETFGSSITLKDENGAFIGPFTPLMYTPTLVNPWLTLAHQVIVHPALTERERELAILPVLSYTKAAYALYAHSKLGLKAGLTEAQVADAKEGRLPCDISESEAAGFQFAKGILEQLVQGGGGRVKDEVFEKAKGVLGTDKVAAVMHTVASFMYSGVMMNAGDVQAPEA